MPKLKMKDPKNVITRSERMMTNHINMFTETLGHYEKSDSKYFFGNELTSVTIDYATNSKMVTKLFSTHIQLVLKNIDMQESWSAKSLFLGAMKPEGLIFKDRSKTPSESITKINADGHLTGELYRLSSSVDLQNIEMKYNKDTKTLTAELNPYAGTFIWVKFPPLYYDVKFKQDDIWALSEMIECIRSYFVHHYRKEI